MEQYPSGFTPDTHPDGFTPDAAAQPSIADKIARIKAGMATQTQLDQPISQPMAFAKDLFRTVWPSATNPTTGHYDPYGVERGAVSIGAAPVPVGAGTTLMAKLAAKASAVPALGKMSVEEAANALAEKIGGGAAAASKLKAGEAVQTALGTKIADLKAAQKTAYDYFNDAAANSIESVKTGTQQVPDIQGVTTVGTKTVPIMTDMPAPVNIKTVKHAVKPILDEIEQELPISQRDASPGYTILKNIINGPDYMPLTAAEKTLSRIKAIGRDEVLPQIKDRAAGIASAVVEPMQSAIDAKAKQIGALDHLNIGRALTKEKYATGQLLNDMSDEPVRLVDYLTQAGDKSIGQLREVAGSVPGELPQIGQSYLKGILQKASVNGKFDPASAMRTYNSLGAESKKLLFGGNVKQLDDLFSIIGQKLQTPSMTMQQLGTTAGAASGGILGHQLGGTLGLGAGATVGAVAGGRVGQFVGNRLNIGGQMMLSADQTARLLMSPQGPGILKTALLTPSYDSSAAQLTKLLLVIASHANGAKGPQGSGQ